MVPAPLNPGLNLNKINSNTGLEGGMCPVSTVLFHPKRKMFTFQRMTKHMEKQKLPRDKAVIRLRVRDDTGAGTLGRGL